MIYYNKLKNLLTLIKNTNKEKLKNEIKKKDFSTDDNTIDDDNFYKDLLKNDITLLEDYLYNPNTTIERFFYIN